MSLRSSWFNILLTLAEAPAHGAAIRRLVLQRSDGEVELYPVTLYGALDAMQKEGLIDEVAEGEGRPPGENARRRYYQLTDRGRAAVADETRRLEELVRVARRVIPAEGG